MSEPVKDWQPYQHIDKACELLDGVADHIEKIARMGGAASAPEQARVLIATAEAHVSIANAKMLGRGRA